jgi:type II secretory pathway pseudopilin PulG
MSRRSRLKGFTGVELLVTLAIAGMIAGVSLPLFFHEIRGTATARVVTGAALATGSAGSWISADAKMAKASNLVDGAAPVSQLTLTWVEWYKLAGVPHSSTYTLSGTDLLRDYDGTVTIVARNISGIAFSQAGRVITLSVSATPPVTPTQTIQRIFRVGLRPKA